jgi:hypothetical protein
MPFAVRTLPNDAHGCHDATPFPVAPRTAHPHAWALSVGTIKLWCNLERRGMLWSRIMPSFLHHSDALSKKIPVAVAPVARASCHDSSRLLGGQASPLFGHRVCYLGNRSSEGSTVKHHLVLFRLALSCQGEDSVVGFMVEASCSKSTCSPSHRPH